MSELIFQSPSGKWIYKTGINWHDASVSSFTAKQYQYIFRWIFITLGDTYPSNYSAGTVFPETRLVLCTCFVLCLICCLGK